MGDTAMIDTSAGAAAAQSQSSVDNEATNNSTTSILNDRILLNKNFRSN